jgi:hypothetical protein
MEQNTMRWEYKSVQMETKGLWGGKVEGSELDRIMNELGEIGWELVSAFDTNEAYGRSRSIVLLFKRPKS